MKYGLPPETIDKIRDVFARFPAIEKAVLYGSRAKGNYKPGSDIDLTLYGVELTSDVCATIDDALDDLLLPYKVDLSIFDELDHVKLKEHIERVGVVFYVRKKKGIAGKAGWKTKALGDVCLIKPPKEEARHRVNDDAEVSFVPMEDMGIDQKYLTATKTRVHSAVTGSYTYFAEGDVLLAKITPCFENGKLGIAANLSNGIGYGSSEYIVFRPSKELNNEWLYYWLSREVFRQEGAARMAGAVGHKRVSKEFIENYPIPLPPLAEQQRLVTILDEAFEGIATAKANAEKNLQNAREIFESDLQSVFSQNHKGWTEARLKSLTTKIGSGATPRGGEESYKSLGISLIRSLNIHDVYFKHRKLAFIDDAQADELSNVEVQSRDVLLNITGASVARCFIVPDDVLPARVNQHVSIIRPISSKLDAEFLHYLLISKPYKDRLLQTGGEGGSTRQAITKAQIQDFSIKYPESVADQKSIVAKLGILHKETKQLEVIYQRKVVALDDLKKSLLHQAFSGEL